MIESRNHYHPPIVIKFVHSLLTPLVFILVTLSPVTCAATTVKQPASEVEVPVLLWNGKTEPAVALDPTNTSSKGVFPPRYLIGTIGSTNSSSTTPGHYHTFDLGNSHEAILTAPECLGCGNFTNQTNVTKDELCPSLVPFCRDSANVSFCWTSHANQSLPSRSFQFLEEASCTDGVRDAGTLFLDDDGGRNVSVCRQCFGYGLGCHSRFFVPAVSHELQFLDPFGDRAVRPNLLSGGFSFGALVRTVPMIDRVWSNIGIGPRSSFLTQTGVESFMLRLDVARPRENAIIFAPDPSRYADATVIPYYIDEEKQKRMHGVSFLGIGTERTQHCRHCGEKGMKFFVDSGNAGISLNDTEVMFDLARMTGGGWLPDEDSDELRLFVPEQQYAPQSSPQLTIALTRKGYDAVEVKLPGGSWVVHPYVSDEGEEIRYEGFRRTIFSTYHKNVLGLPVLVAPGINFVFHDGEQKLYLVHDNDTHDETEISVEFA